jgi:glycine/D-amino acid oxidase-like deaminating enzyme
LDARLLTETPETVLPDAPDFLLTHTAQHLPAISQRRETGTVRVCDRVMPADELPIIGRLPDAEGVTVAVTHSGVTLAPLIAALLAEEILTGKLPPILRPFSPHRFVR